MEGADVISGTERDESDESEIGTPVWKTARAAPRVPPRAAPDARNDGSGSSFVVILTNPPVTINIHTAPRNAKMRIF